MNSTEALLIDYLQCCNEQKHSCPLEFQLEATIVLDCYSSLCFLRPNTHVQVDRNFSLPVLQMVTFKSKKYILFFLEQDLRNAELFFLTTETVVCTKSGCIIWNNYHFWDKGSRNLNGFDYVFRSSHRRCFVKNVFLEMSQNLQKNICARVFFNKVAGLRPATLFKKRLWHKCFPGNFAKFLRTPFLQNTSDRMLLCRFHLLAEFCKLRFLSILLSFLKIHDY